MAKLSELKALIAKAPKNDPAIVKRERASRDAGVSRNASRVHTPGSAPDIDLAQAFAGVTRLTPVNRASPRHAKPSTVPTQRLADEANALAASKFGAEPSPAAWDIGQEHEAHQTFVRRGLGSDILVKLRRGHWVVQGEIDLHGMTRIEAHDALVDFFDAARGHGWRCVRVIHGKGLSSPNREPVLKAKVQRWLTHWDDVLAYCEAQPHAGGSGAMLILLKSRAS
jgi:DNA-nicking Smr family endonuclease